VPLALLQKMAKKDGAHDGAGKSTTNKGKGVLLGSGVIHKAKEILSGRGAVAGTSTLPGVKESTKTTAPGKTSANTLAKTSARPKPKPNPKPKPTTSVLAAPVAAPHMRAEEECKSFLKYYKSMLKINR